MSWKKMLIGSALTLGVFTGLMGFAHTEAGKPLLHMLANAAGCPVDFEGGDPAKVEAYRREQLQARMGSEAARGHHAPLGFTLGSTTRADVDAWVAANDADCKSKRHDSVLQCRGIMVDDSGECGSTLDDVHLQFDEGDRLVAVDVFRRGLDSERAIGLFEASTSALDAEVGPATATAGTADAEHLAEAAYRHAAREYHYRGYVAKVSVTSFPTGGVRLREQYQWLPNS